MDTWTTRDGHKIRITDMGDRHLNNTVRHCERMLRLARDEYSACASYCARGDAAYDAQMSAMNNIEGTMEFFRTALEALRNEQAVRGF